MAQEEPSRDKVLASISHLQLLKAFSFALGRQAVGVLIVQDVHERSWVGAHEEQRREQ